MRLAILGALEVRDDDQLLPLGPLKQRIVLGLLLCRANQIVSVAALTDALWDDDPPRTAHKNLQVYISSLRKMIGTGSTERNGARLLHRPPGYLIQVGAEHLDSLRFNDLGRRGRRAMRDGDAVTAVNLLGQAVRMWRGPALPDLISAASIATEVEQLHEQFLATYEDWAEAKLALGQHTDLLDSVGGLVRRYPFRERLRHVQMLALFRSGRHTEALAQYDAMRQGLARELGLQPSPVLTRLYESILSGSRSLEVAAPGRLPPISVRTSHAPQSNLIRDVADFTGRAGQVQALLTLLGAAADGTIAAISGAAGAGKTALAVHCAHRVGSRFPDGRIIVRMRAGDGSPRTTSEVVDDLLRASNPGGTPSGGPQERAALLRELTAERQILLVLDDAVTEAQVRAVLEVADDSVVVVVTSRHRLGGLESAVHIPLEPMPDDEAAALLGRLVGPQRIAADRAAARRLTEICGGLPLVIRIVGAKLGGLRHLPLARYAERLSDERRLLDELIAGDLEVRSRLASSFRDLSRADQETLRCLASLPGPTFAASDVADALGIDAVRAEDAIERLIEAHLVNAEAGDVVAHISGFGPFYALPSLIRLFVREMIGREPLTGSRDS